MRELRCVVFCISHNGGIGCSEYWQLANLEVDRSDSVLLKITLFTLNFSLANVITVKHCLVVLSFYTVETWGNYYLI